MTSRRLSRLLALAVLGLGAVWLAATAGLYAAMRQRPERFGAIMAHVPMPAMIVLPFKPLWMSARAGRLQVGDPAPDFALPQLDSKRVVTLSAEYAQKPVVLAFGSYT